MGLLDWFSRRMVSMATKVGEKAIYPDIKSEFLIKEAYAGNDAVYTIISTSAKKFAAIPRSVYQDRQMVKAYKQRLENFDPVQVRKAYRSMGKAIVDSGYLKLFKRPNPLMGSDSFLEAVYISKELIGESFIWINRGDSTTQGDGRYAIKPLELYVLPPQHVELVCDDNDLWGVTGYVLNNSGVRIPLNKEDVVHWKTYNPNFDAYTREHLRGLSPLKAGLKLFTGNEAAKDAMVAMFQNQGAKGILFNESLDMLTKSQKDQLEGVISRKINNLDVKGAVATLQGKWGYIDLGMSSMDMQLLSAQDATFSRLCNLYRVSPNLFISGQTRDNLREARKDLITNKVIPDAMSFDDELNRVISKSYNGHLLVSDFTELPEMQYEMADMGSILSSMFDRGVITANEYREQMGYEVTSQPEHNQYFLNGIPITEVAMPDLNGPALANSIPALPKN